VTAAQTIANRRFETVLIKPSHYDDQGYVIQWWKAWIPSNSMACLYAMVQDLQRRRVLGEDVEIGLTAYDEMNTVLPIRKIIRQIKDNGNSGLVCMVGVQSNQFPRAMDMARQFRAASVDVAIGGFHVSGCISMLPELPLDLQEAKALGISLFAGEAEEHLHEVFQDAYAGKLKPVYNFMHDLPNLQNQVETSGNLSRGRIL
jgi:hypothetical protein